MNRKNKQTSTIKSRVFDWAQGFVVNPLSKVRKKEYHPYTMKSSWAEDGTYIGQPEDVIV